MKLNIREVCSAAIFFLGFMVCIGTNVQAQNNSDLEAFQDQFKNDYFSVGILLQTLGQYQYMQTTGTGNNGFSVGNARFKVSGEVEKTFGYELQANFIKNPAVLDANMYYNFTSRLTLKAGLFKSPFSGEELTSTSALDFVSRSTAVNQLVPSRQIGLQLGGDLSEGRLRYKVGVFNGNGFNINQNRDNQFLYVGRLETHLAMDEKSENKIVWGVNASFEQKDRALSSGNLRSTFQGEQVLAGSDIRFMHSGLMLSGEFIYSWLKSDSGIQSNPFGCHGTAGYYVTSKTQFLVRWDWFDNDNVSTVTDSETLLAGLNYFPSSLSKIQLNYIYPTSRDIEFSRILLNLQISL